MNSLTVPKTGKVETVPSSFEEKLVWLTRFGRPSVGVFDSGWHASIEMHVADTVKGTSFKVRSDFGLSSPAVAVDELIVRVLSTLSQLTLT